MPLLTGSERRKGSEHISTREARETAAFHGLLPLAPHATRRISMYCRSAMCCRACCRPSASLTATDGAGKTALHLATKARDATLTAAILERLVAAARANSSQPDDAPSATSAFSRQSAAQVRLVSLLGKQLLVFTECGALLGDHRALVRRVALGDLSGTARSIKLGVLRSDLACGG